MNEFMKPSDSEIQSEFGDFCNIGFHERICVEITSFAVTSIYMGKDTKCIAFFFFAELETQAMDVFREYLKDRKYQDIERFFNEWKMTFHTDGPFQSEQDLQILSQKMTKPDDFMVRIINYSTDVLFS